VGDIAKLPVKLMFDPAGNYEVAPLWDIPAGRILLLLWRPCHLIGTEYYAVSVRIAKRIERTRPQTVAELRRCFEGVDPYAEYAAADLDRFCPRAIHYFAGRLGVPYCGIVSGVATMFPSLLSTT